MQTLSRDTYTYFAVWVIGAFCLCIPALYNSYPLVTSDSGAYISGSYMHQLPLDRPIFYSLFVRVFSLGASLWGVILVQALMLSFLLLKLATHHLKPFFSSKQFIALLFLISVGTSGAWFVGQIMPDIFTAILLLSLLIIATVPLNKWQTALQYSFILISILVHSSNLLIVFFMGLIMLIIPFFRKNATIRKLGFGLLCCFAFSWIAQSSLNAISGRGFRPSAASHIFIMSRMVENGILDNFLADYCPTDTPSYSLCAFQGKLPDRQWDFMWEANGVFNKTGGWEGTEKDYYRIIKKTLITPKYLLMHVEKAANATFRQLPLLYVGDGLIPYDANSSPGTAISQHISNELKEFKSSNQANNTLSLPIWNTILGILSVFLILLALMLPTQKNQNKDFTILVFICVIYLFINAAVTASLATVVGRYESRVFWVLPFIASLYVLKNINNNFKQKNLH